MASRFNNKKGSLSFDDFLQIVCRIYSLKGVNHYLVMWWLLLLSLSSPLGQGSGSLRKQPTFCDVTWFAHEMTSEKRAQKIHFDDTSLLGWCFWLVETNCQPIRSTTGSLWNFCICFSDAISWGNHSGGVAKCRLLSQAWGLVGCANIVLGCIVDNMLVLLILVTLKPSVGEDILLNSKIFFSTNKSFPLLKYLGWN